ncbi:MAG: hypothetical protein ABIH64_03280, partial [Nanoarchaeota archaeon]
LPIPIITLGVIMILWGTINRIVSVSFLFFGVFLLLILDRYEKGTLFPNFIAIINKKEKWYSDKVLIINIIMLILSLANIVIFLIFNK